MNKILKDRFLKKVELIPFHECWEWIGARDTKGYGNFHLNNKKRKAHRVSWEIHNGKIPEGEGYHKNCILHKCDNPGCVNPNHLFLGTQSENMKDMVSKNRQRHPSQSNEKNGMCRITNKEILKIRKLYFQEKMSQSEIGRKLRISQPHISNIIRNKKRVFI